MKTVTAYISGPISSHADLNVHAFNAAQERLQFEGYAVINPHDLPKDHGKKWHDYMRACIRALMASDCVFVLDNWERSRGARVEVLVAKFLRMQVFDYRSREHVHLSFWTALKTTFSVYKHVTY